MTFVSSLLFLISLIAFLISFNLILLWITLAFLFILIIIGCPLIMLIIRNDRTILKTFGNPDNKDKFFNISQETITVHDNTGGISGTSNFVFSKNGLFLKTLDMCIEWENIIKVEITGRQINIQIGDKRTYKGDYVGVSLPNKKHLLLLVKTFYKGEVVGEDRTTVFDRKKAFVYSNVKFAVMRITAVLIPLPIAIGLSVGGLAALADWNATASTIIAVIISVPLVMIIILRLKGSITGKLTVTDDYIELKKSDGLSGRTSTAVTWEKVKRILYNKKHIKIDAEPIIVYHLRQKILSAIVRVAEHKGIVVERTEQLLFSRPTTRPPLTKNHFLDVAYGKIYYLGGVNIFDFYNDNYKISKTKTIPIEVFSNKAATVINTYRIRYYSVKGRFLHFRIGIAEYFPDCYAIFHYSKRERVYEFEDEKDFDFLIKDNEKNTEHKLQTAADIIKHTIQEEHDYIYSPCYKYRGKIITLSDNEFEAETEVLELIDNDTGFFINNDLYSFALVGRKYVVPTKNAAHEYIQSFFVKSFVPSRDSFDCLIEDKNNIRVLLNSESDEALAEARGLLLSQLHFILEIAELNDDPDITEELMQKLQSAGSDLTKIITCLSDEIVDVFGLDELNTEQRQMLTDVAELIQEFVLID